jgi:hypothetical protein
MVLEELFLSLNRSSFYHTHLRSSSSNLDFSGQTNVSTTSGEWDLNLRLVLRWTLLRVPLLCSKWRLESFNRCSSV